MLQIAVLEDSSLSQEVLRIILSKLGHNIVAMYDNGEDMLTFLDNRKVDLVLLDITVNGNLTGIDVARKIDVPFMFISGHDEEYILSKALMAKPINFISKPYTHVQVEAVLRLFSAEISANNGTEVELMDGARKVAFMPKEFLFSKNNDHYLHINLTHSDEVVRMSGTKFLELMPDDTVVKVHRSYIVNPYHIKSYDSRYVTLSDKRKIPLSRKYKTSLDEILKK